MTRNTFTNTTGSRSEAVYIGAPMANINLARSAFQTGRPVNSTVVREWHHVAELGMTQAGGTHICRHMRSAHLLVLLVESVRTNAGNTRSRLGVDPHYSGVNSSLPTHVCDCMCTRRQLAHSGNQLCTRNEPPQVCTNSGGAGMADYRLNGARGVTPRRAPFPTDGDCNGGKVLQA